MKHDKSNSEILHPRVLGQHPLRLPPAYLPEESYREIFEAISVLESQIYSEMQLGFHFSIQTFCILF